MLAEPRKKVRYSNNPCGNLWANDTSGFGRQMLERLGWAPGKGLGKNNDGIEKPIKASAKSDRRGLGKNIDYALGSTKQLEDYAQLLKSLNKSYSSAKSSSSTSLEQISKSSSSRLHYHKFVRAKDTSKYDAKSLNVILGGTLENESAKTTAEDQTDEPKNVDPPAHSSDFGIKTVTSSMSMADYFKSRLSAIRTKKTGSAVESSEKTADQPESQQSVAITRSRKRKRAQPECENSSAQLCEENHPNSVVATDIEPSDKSHSVQIQHNPNNCTVSSSKKSEALGMMRTHINEAIHRSPFAKTNLLSLPGYQPY